MSTTPRPGERPRFEHLPDLPTTPSPLAEARRVGMLTALTPHVRARGRRRIVARVGVVAASIALTTLLALALTRALPQSTRTPSTPGVAAQSHPREAPTPASGPTPAATEAAASPSPATRLVAYVADDPSVVARVAPDPERPAVEILDDDGLLATLRSADLPAGLVRADGRTRLAFRDSGPQDPLP